MFSNRVVRPVVVCLLMLVPATGFGAAGERHCRGGTVRVSRSARSMEGQRGGESLHPDTIQRGKKKVCNLGAEAARTTREAANMSPATHRTTWTTVHMRSPHPRAAKKHTKYDAVTAGRCAPTRLTT